MLYFLRHLVSVLLLPFTVAVIVPLFLLTDDKTRSLRPNSTSFRVLLIVAGLVLLAIGLTLFWFTVSQFARRGKGTLAPWDPPRVLVVEGVYRYVRNPMISGLLFVLLAEALLTGSLPVLVWFGLFFVANLVYLPLFEEPGLKERFGDRYLTYQKNVPRWIPRATPWNPPWQ